MNVPPMQVTLGFDYVLILEWLAEGDQPTGGQLHAFLPTVGFKSKLVVCHSWNDVQQALNNCRISCDWTHPISSIGYHLIS